MTKQLELFNLSIKPLFNRSTEMLDASKIDWTNPKAKISKYFTVKDACLLPSWGKIYQPDASEQANILKMAQVMDRIRDYVQFPVSISCWIRPKAYNAAIGGAPASMHIPGLAVDWYCVGKLCDNLRKFMLPMLPVWGVRMEDKPGSGWVHVDLKQVEDKYKFFKP